jgi:hypothetical protein
MQSKADLIASLKASLNDSTSGEAPAPKSKGTPVTKPIIAAATKSAPLTPVTAKAVDASHPFAKFLNNQEDEQESEEDTSVAVADEEGESEEDATPQIDAELVDDLDALVRFVLEKQHSLRQVIDYLRDNQR